MLNPFALPVHPALVHFPMAMLTATWACVVVRYVTGDLRWDRWGRVFEFVGVLALPFVIVAGFVDTRGFGFLLPPRFDAPLVWHMLAALAAATAFATHLAWRRHLDAAKVVGRLALQEVLLVTIGMTALLAAGLIAGELVYGA